MAIVLRCWQYEVVGAIPGRGGSILLGVECEKHLCTVLWVHVKEPQVVKANLESSTVVSPITYSVVSKC